MLQELTRLRRWHCWEYRNGAKIPIQINGENAKSNDPNTWTDYNSAYQAAKKNKNWRLAFEICEPYCGIDLDNILMPNTGVVKQGWAKAILKKFSGVGYAEVSVSKTGVKIITRARKPDGARSVLAFDDGGSIEVYDNRRFWAMEDVVFAGEKNIGDGQEQVDWLYEHVFPAQQPQRPQMPVTISVNGVFDRAVNYIANTEQASEGDRNNNTFRLAGNLAALETDGQFLTQEQVEYLVMEWNSRNLPPLPEDEVRKTVSSALKNGTARQSKPAEIDEGEPDYGGVDFTDWGKLVDENTIKTWKKRDDIVVPDELMLDGEFLGDITELITSTAPKPNTELAFAAALAVLSVVTAGQIENYRRLRTNMMIIALAETGGGKEHPRAIANQILFEAGLDDRLAGERIGSNAGLLATMAAQPFSFFSLDEFTGILNSMNSPRSGHYLRDIATSLLTLYSSASKPLVKFDVYADPKKQPVVRYPHLVLLGSAVTAEFWKTITPQNAHGGMMGRFLIFSKPDDDDAYQDVPTPESIPHKIATRAREWAELRSAAAGDISVPGSAPLRPHYDDDARKRLFDHARTCSSREKKTGDSFVDGIWARHAEKTEKLAMAFACSRFIPGEDPLKLRVTLDDANRAIALNNILTRRMIFGLEKMPEEKYGLPELSTRILEYLRSKGEEGQTKSKLFNAVRANGVSRQNRRDALENMIEDGLIMATLIDAEKSPTAENVKLVALEQD